MTRSRALSEVSTASATSLPLKKDSVTLTVTSPPYHNAIDYSKHIQKNTWYRGNAGIALEPYLEDMTTAFREVYDATRQSGFCCIVIGNELSNGTMIPLPHLLVERLSEPNGPWKFHEEIIWSKVTGGLDRFGVTIQRPFPTYYRANIMHEHILILRKGGLKHVQDSSSKFEYHRAHEERYV